MNRHLKNARRRSAHSKHELANFRMICGRIAADALKAFLEEINQFMARIYSVLSEKLERI